MATFTVKVKNSVSYADMTTESNAIAYRAVWQMNQPATVEVLLNDVDFASTQTYGDAYIGTSALLLEEPTNTEIFRGRIIGATTSPKGYLLLRGEDWLGQLDDRLVNYDTREDLDYNGAAVLRESNIYPYLNAGTRTNALVEAGGNTNIYMDYGSNDMSIWGVDIFNGMKFCLPVSHMGTQTDTVLAYDETYTGVYDVENTNTPAAGEENTWVIDDNCHTLKLTENDAVTAWFMLSYAMNTLASQETVGTITKATLTLDYETTDSVDRASVYINTATDGTGDDKPVGTLNDNNERNIFTAELSNAAINAIVADGWSVKVYCVGPANTACSLGGKVYYVKVDVEYEVTTALSTQYTIDDTLTHAGDTHNELVFTGETLVTNGLIDYMPFYICDKITAHVAALVAAYDELYALDASDDVTASTTYVGRHYHMMSPLAILRDLAKADGTDFWLKAWDGDSLDLVWNDTYIDMGMPTWTDSSVLYWDSPTRDLEDVINEWFVEGYTSGDYKAVDSDTDAGSITSYGQRSKYKNNPDLPTSKECDIEAGVLVDRTKDLPYQLGCAMNGWNTTTLGSVIEITSTDLNLAAQQYIITRKEYDSRQGVTFFTLTPRDGTNYTLNPHRGLHDTLNDITTRIQLLESMLERGERYNHEWA
jgi:hypothetical protein